jgi:hypothetical protein
MTHLRATCDVVYSKGDKSLMPSPSKCWLTFSLFVNKYMAEIAKQIGITHLVCSF